MRRESWQVKLQEPKDLGVKIGSEEEIFWIDLKKKMELGNKNARREILINEKVLEFCDKRIAEEKEKFK